MTDDEHRTFDQWLRLHQGQSCHAPIWVFASWAELALHRHVEREEILHFLMTRHDPPSTACPFEPAPAYSVAPLPASTFPVPPLHTRPVKRHAH